MQTGFCILDLQNYICNACDDFVNFAFLTTPFRLTILKFFKQKLSGSHSQLRYSQKQTRWFQKNRFLFH